VRVTLTPRAKRRLDEIILYIADDDPEVALAVRDRILQALERLRDFPELGRPGRVRGTRELPVRKTRYIVVYRFDERRVDVLDVRHSAQLWPEAF
jgi:addiction module RelE/StbE family toxin